MVTTQLYRHLGIYTCFPYGSSSISVWMVFSSFSRERMFCTRILFDLAVRGAENEEEEEEEGEWLGWASSLVLLLLLHESGRRLSARHEKKSSS